MPYHCFSGSEILTENAIYVPVQDTISPSRYEALTPGSKDHVALFADELFSMRDETALEVFLRQPWRFSEIPLPAKLPPAKIAQDVNTLPMLGLVIWVVVFSVIALVYD